MSQQANLVMHKLVGKHVFMDSFNSDTFETEHVCLLCGFIQNTKPKNVKNKEHALDGYRYGLISTNDALKLLGLSETANDLESLISR